MIRVCRKLACDTRGKAAIKLAIGSCLVAAAAATSSPAFETNPLIGKTIGQFREHLPKTLDTIRHAMGG
ncbi:MULTISPECIES: hypothetical protein [unclassified Sphingomonas]|nr:MULTISPECIES: hypothetical protein [unclassified Sphingomonas]KRB88714.1 hypothetical protein ASE22_20025 [Sphingomonas sp. Root720]